MFSKSQEALMFMKNDISDSDIRRKAIDKIIEDPACSFIFLKDCKWTVDERKEAIKSIMKNGQVIYLFYINMVKTTEEIKLALSELMYYEQYMSLLMRTHKFSDEEINILVDTIIEKQNINIAEKCLQNMRLSVGLVERLYATILMGNMVKKQ